MQIDASSIYTSRLQRQNSPFEQILEYGKMFSYKKGDKYFPTKSSDSIFFYIDKGCVTLFHDISNGKSVQILKFYEGNTFGTSVSVVSGYTDFRTYDVHYEFLEDSLIWSFPSKFITEKKMIVKYPDIIAYVLRQQCLKTLIMHNNFTMRNEESAEKKLSNFILNIALDNESSTCINQKISQTELSDSLGIHRTTLSRALRKLREKNIIGAFTSTRLEIIDMDMLRFIVAN